MDGLDTIREEDTKPHLVWLGRFLGLDIYIDVQPTSGNEGHIKKVRRIFDALVEEKK